MTPSTSFTTLFLDIGGVLLTNGWDHNIRRRSAEKFRLDYDEMNEDMYRITLDIAQVRPEQVIYMICGRKTH